MHLVMTVKEWRREISSLLLAFIRDRQRVVNALTVAVIFIGITGFGACQHTRLARYMSITYAVLAALGLQLSLRSLPAGLFIMWTAFIFYVHPMTPILAALTAVLCAGGLLVITSGAAKIKQVALNMICVYALANVLWQLLQITGHTIGYSPVYHGWFSLVGLQTNIGETSALLAICLPAFFRRRWVWLLPVPIAGIIMAKVTVGMMALGVVGILYVVSVLARRKKQALIALSLLAATLAAGIVHVTLIDPFIWQEHKNSRLQTWEESTLIALGKPVRGQGFGQFCTMVPLLSTPLQLTVADRLRLYDEVEDKEHFKALAQKITGGDAAAYYKDKKYPDHFYFEAHNEFIEVLFAAGIPGLIFLLGALGHIAWRGWKQRDPIPLFGLSASCAAATVWFVWQIVPIAVITVAWVGLCLAGRNE